MATREEWEEKMMELVKTLSEQVLFLSDRISKLEQRMLRWDVNR